MKVDKTKRNIQINLCSDTAKRIYRLYSKGINKMFAAYKSKEKAAFWTSEKETELSYIRPDGMEVVISILGSVLNPTGPKGTAADLNIIDESGLVSRKFIEEGAFQATTKTEGINIVTGTVEANDYYTLFRKAKKKMLNGSKNWFAFYMKWGDAWDKDTLSDAAREAIYDSFDMDDPTDVMRFKKEQLCEWLAGLEGAPYAQSYHEADEQGRIGYYPFDKRYRVGQVWDDGRGNTTVWFWQFIDGMFRIIESREWLEGNLPEIGDDILRMYSHWNVRIGYVIMPHTMKEKSYTTRGSLSRASQIQKHFRYQGHYIVVPRTSSIEAKLSCGKRFFPFCQFDETGCWDGLNHLQLYSRQVNRSTGAYSNNIKPDKHSHAGDAFGELAMAWHLGLFGDNLSQED